MATNSALPVRIGLLYDFPQQGDLFTKALRMCIEEVGGRLDRDVEFVERQSRGLPIVSEDERLKPVIDSGRAIFTARQGQLNLTCAQCHDDNWGRKLAGITLPQGHPTGYPVYRLEWQTLGSLQRRLRNCMIGMRVEPYAYGAPEYLALEAYLMWRARGMAIESPAVRP